jgi:hypothetical protein
MKGVTLRSSGKCETTMEKIMDATQTVKDALDANPEMRLVLEIATRARELEQMEPPKNFGISTEIISSQYLARQATQS